MNSYGLKSVSETEGSLENENRYKELFENNPMPMWVYNLETLDFIDVNDASVIHYGYSKEEFLLMTILNIRPVDEIPRLKQNLSSQKLAFERSCI